MSDSKICIPIETTKYKEKCSQSASSCVIFFSLKQYWHPAFLNVQSCKMCMMFSAFVTKQFSLKHLNYYIHKNKFNLLERTVSA